MCRWQTGASAVELAIAGTVVLGALVAIVDLSRVALVRVAVKAQLTEGIRMAENKFGNVVDLPKLTRDSKEYRDFKSARNKVISHAQAFKSSMVPTGSGVTFRSFEHIDQLNGETVRETTPFAYLLPGTAGVVVGSNEYVTNSHICPAASTDLEDPGFAAGGSNGPCADGARRRGAAETLPGLSAVYPLELSAFVQVRTFMMGTFDMVITEGGFAGDSFGSDPGQNETPFSTPISTDTPTSTPTDTPTETPTEVPSATPTSVRPTHTATPDSTPVSSVTPTVTATVAATNSPSNTPTPIPTKTATPSPTPNQCDYYTGQIKWDGTFGNQDKSLAQFFMRGPGTQSMTCIDNWVTEITNFCRNYKMYGMTLNATHGGNFGKNSEDCFVAQLAAKFFHNDANGNQHTGANPNGAYCSELMRTDLFYCPKKGQNNGGINSCRTCGTGTFYFDSACQPVAPKAGETSCGNIMASYQQSSPISLVWEAGHDLEASSHIVQFPLDPNGAGRSYEWKASDKAPLVVYDPSHTGKITNATQLFGDWTFGGRRSASLSNDSAAQQKWENGFEALATLDADGNEMIDGVELEALALWFDKNRNGVSEDGEVVTMGDVGVTKLFTSYSSVDAITKAVKANVGFERVVDGKAVHGASIDWYGGSSLNPMDLLAMSAKGSNKAATSKIAEPKGATTDATVSDLAKASDGATTLSGIWAFRIAGSDVTGSFPSGHLVLSDNPVRGGTVIGYSTVSQAFRAAGSDRDISQMSMFQLSGTKSASAKGEVKFDFTIDRDGSQLVSHATVDADLMKMNGTSTVDVNGKSVTYNWTAERSR